ncbi:MAG: pyridoxamine 5'-phosphate oxidase family protein [Desulfovibrio sp.]|uniref:pyridoxamine 5'-phosphate oxidase family protein n=1 Tax=Desulfovibrio sp. TaxID=885 RepID=UPI0039E2A7AC
MQARMKEHQLTADQIVALLDKTHVGHLGTVDEKGFPYVTPVHFVHLDDSIYFHGLAKGRKLANLMAYPKVCFEIEGEYSYIQADTPCDTNTAYQSVIITGRAATVDSLDLKTRALEAIVAKYTPQHSGKNFPASMLQMTAVVEITIIEITGKYYA